MLIQETESTEKRMTAVLTDKAGRTALAALMFMALQAACSYAHDRRPDGRSNAMSRRTVDYEPSTSVNHRRAEHRPLASALAGSMARLPTHTVGRTPMHQPAVRFAIACIKMALATIGAAQDSQFSTSSSTWTPKGIRAVIGAGANLEARNEDGVAPLMLAASNNAMPDVVRALLDAGANVEARDKEGWTPQTLAARYIADPAVVRVLVDSG